MPGYSLVYWLAVFAPAGTPKDIQKKLADAIAEAMKDPAHGQGHDAGPHGISPLPLDDFAAYVKDRDDWWTDRDQGRGHRTGVSST